jgi:hypothetical protein
MKTGNPTFADDLAVVCIHKRMLQAQLNTVYGYSSKWRFKFNPGKSLIIIYGKDMCPDMPLYMGQTEIKITKGDLHMGIYIGQDKEMEHSFVAKRIYKAKKAFFAAQSIGTKSVPIQPVTMSRLYWTICVPRMVHGLEILPISDSSLDELEQAHGSMAKIAQGLPAQTANVAVLATLGWRSMATHIDLLKLLFMWRLLLLPMKNPYKMITLVRLWSILYYTKVNHTGPLYDIVKVFQKYGIMDTLDHAIKSGHCMPMLEFKGKVTNLITEVENERFKITCVMYKKIMLFSQCISNINMWSWWHFSHNTPEFANKIRVMCCLLVSQTCLNSVVHHYRKSSPNCHLCTEHVNESVDHLLFDCKHFTNIRKQLWHDACVVLPPAMVYGFDKMSSVEKTVFMLSGMNCDYISEWNDIYIAIANFIYGMYIERRKYIET